MPAMLYVLPILVAGALLAWERLAPACASQRGEWMNNTTAFALGIFSQTCLVPLIAIGETALINRLGGGLFDLRLLPWMVGAAAWLAAMDLGEYLFHRAQHALPWLWAMHSLHHSDRAMNFTTSQRHFWLEPAIKAVSIWPAAALLFKTDAGILGVYFVASLWHLATHANVRLGFGPLSWLLNSPRYHRLHHSRDEAHYNANFAALLPIFDVLAGSYRRPRGGEFPATGLAERVERPLDLVAWPARRYLGRGATVAGPQAQAAGPR